MWYIEYWIGKKLEKPQRENVAPEESSVWPTHQRGLSSEKLLKVRSLNRIGSLEESFIVIEKQ